MAEYQDYTEETAPTDDDLVLLLNAPGGTKTTRKITLGNLKAYAEAFTVYNGGNAGTTETLSLANGDLQRFTLDQTSCTFTMPSNASPGELVVELTQGTGGNKAAVFTAVDWVGGSAPTLSTAAGAYDTLSFWTPGGGAAWRGSHVAAPGSGGATNLDGLSDVVITSVAANHILRHNGTNFVNVPLPAELAFALSDETTSITTGTAKLTVRMPFAMTLTSVRASVNTASTSGVVTVDINEGGTTVLSTKLTIDANEKTSTTAAAAPVISDSALADDAEITFDIDTAGTGAKGLKVWLIGTRV